MQITLPDTQIGRDLMVSVERGDVSGASFGFTIPNPNVDQGWEELGGQSIRTIKRARLFDVGPVTFPAYGQTDVARRSLVAWREGLVKAWEDDVRRLRQRLLDLGA
jgi:HK97 family phage prohead protease